MGRWARLLKAPKALARAHSNLRRRSGGNDSGSTKYPNTTFPSASAAATKNGARGSMWLAKKPPMAGPSVKPNPQAAPMKPKFLWRFASLLMSPM